MDNSKINVLNFHASNQSPQSCTILCLFMCVWPKDEWKMPQSGLGSMRGKKYRNAEYVQSHVCFVNEEVSWPHSNINVKFCTSRLCMKMSSFLFVCAWAMPRILYISWGVPFPVWTPDNISGLISVVLWLLRWEVIKKKFR